MPLTAYFTTSVDDSTRSTTPRVSAPDVSLTMTVWPGRIFSANPESCAPAMTGAASHANVTAAHADPTEIIEAS